MKKLFHINKWLVIATLVLYLTVFLGALFQMVLGTVQIVMSLFILTNWNTLTIELKRLFLAYLALTTTILTFLFTESLAADYWIFGVLVIPMCIAFFHLYITYKIYKA